MREILELPTYSFEGCNVCRTPRSHMDDPQKLSRCGGCTTTFYCSKVCQKVAWPSHRSTCQAPLKEAVVEGDWRDLHWQRLGYPTASSFLDTLRDWISMHQGTLADMANICVHNENGLAANLRSPHVFSLLLVPLPYGQPGPDVHPGRAFTSRYNNMMHREEHPFIARGWPEAKSRTDARAALIRTGRSAGPSTIAGVIPAIFFIQGFEVTVSTSFPVYRIRRGSGPGETMFTPAECTALEPEPELLAFQYDEVKKTWRAKPFEAGYWDFIAQRMAQRPDLAESRLHPRTLWQIYQKL
ncbi:hypothetical protein C8Q80DRAFT_1120296 [Daedaleopsis nitida]|nr:hypothetical protein C8Q80DRAFT_1120296 [Daedaleopsis nitida]